MNLEGQIEIDLTVQPDGSKQVQIVNNRPVQASQLFVGKTIDEALAIIPLLFHVCGKAQGFAAINAIHSAIKAPIDGKTALARELLCQSEQVREHLLRIFMDWPSHLPKDTPIDTGPDLQTIMQLTPKFEAALFPNGKPFDRHTLTTPNLEDLEQSLATLFSFLSDQVFGCPVETWITADKKDIVLHWIETGSTIAAKSCRDLLQKKLADQGQTQSCFLPSLSGADLHPLLFSESANHFVANPIWQGVPRETSALSRQFKHPLLQTILIHCGPGLLARYMARLIEIAMIAMRIKTQVQQIKQRKHAMQKLGAFNTTTGIGIVEAARGLLVHGVELKDTTIQQYRILAPTEWNFHENGPLAQALGNITSTKLEQIRAIADMIIPSIDPCTQTKLEVRCA